MSGGSVIRIARQAMGLSQAQLGALFGEGRQYVGQIERGERPEHEVMDLAGAIGWYLGGKQR